MATLLVLDYDWSLISENSDTWVISRLGADEIYKQGREAGMPWTQLMDHTLKEAASQLGRTQADVVAALHATPLHPALASLLRDAAAAGGGTAVDTLILSDANTVYIEETLRHHGLLDFVMEVHTNPAEWRQGALRVAPYHSQPHGCRRRCPANLCKGQVLQEFLERQLSAGRHYQRALYVGDGRGDFCPSMLLLHGPAASGSPGSGAAAAAAAAGDGAAHKAAAAAAATPGKEGSSCPPCGGSSNRIFARREYPDGLPCALWVMLRGEAGGASGATNSHGAGSSEAAASGSGPGAAAAAGQAARVVPWTQPDELAQLLRLELGLPA